MSFARCAAGEHLGLRSVEGGINGDTSPESAVFTEKDACDSEVSFGGLAALPCLSTDHCPQLANVVTHPLPSVAELATMPNRFAGVAAPTLGARLGAPSAGTIGSRRRVCSIGPTEHQEVWPEASGALPRVPAKPRR